ncbi:YjzD family protein [Leuconostocaceae bacterium ESL0958]|nr:YjzD family protein [Leuconostocaceae bacterium ESL0958]
MRYLIAALWSALFGLLIGYLISQMTSVDFNPMAAMIVTIIVGEAALIGVPMLSKGTTTDQQ